MHSLVVNVADRLWKAELAACCIEDEICKLICSCLTSEENRSYEDFTTDASDRSIEVYGLPSGLVDEKRLRGALHAIGFDLVWLHYHSLSDRWKDGVPCRCPATAAKELLPCTP